MCVPATCTRIYLYVEMGCGYLRVLGGHVKRVSVGHSQINFKRNLKDAK